MKAVFQANDGKIFETEEECKAYEEFQKSKPRIITDWLLENIINDTENLTPDALNKEGEEGEDDEEAEDYPGLIEALKRLAEQKEIDKIIELNEEISSLLWRWKEFPEELLVATLTISLLKDRVESGNVATFRKALDIFIKVYLHTRFEQGVPRFPNISKPWTSAGFTSSVMYGKFHAPRKSSDSDFGAE